MIDWKSHELNLKFIQGAQGGMWRGQVDSIPTYGSRDWGFEPWCLAANWGLLFWGNSLCIQVFHLSIAIGFKLMAEGWHCRQIIHVSYGLDAVLTLIWFNMLRSACLLGHLRRFLSWQTSKLYQMATVQHRATNTQETSSSIHHASLMDKADSIHGHQGKSQPRWMISYSQVGGSFPFHERNCYVAMYFCLYVTVCTSFC
jgi:hypothetical protein